MTLRGGGYLSRADRQRYDHGLAIGLARIDPERLYAHLTVDHRLTGETLEGLIRGVLTVEGLAGFVALHDDLHGHAHDLERR